MADEVLGGAAPPGPTVACIVDSGWPGICIRDVLDEKFIGAETDGLCMGLSNGLVRWW